MFNLCEIQKYIFNYRNYREMYIYIYIFFNFCSKIYCTFFFTKLLNFEYIRLDEWNIDRIEKY